MGVACEFVGGPRDGEREVLETVGARVRVSTMTQKRAHAVFEDHIYIPRVDSRRRSLGPGVQALDYRGVASTRRYY